MVVRNKPVPNGYANWKCCKQHRTKMLFSSDLPQSGDCHKVENFKHTQMPTKTECCSQFFPGDLVFFRTISMSCRLKTPIKDVSEQNDIVYLYAHIYTHIYTHMILNICILYIYTSITSWYSVGLYIYTWNTYSSHMLHGAGIWIPTFALVQNHLVM